MRNGVSSGPDTLTPRLTLTPIAICRGFSKGLRLDPGNLTGQAEDISQCFDRFSDIK